jgi:hypothetical protein
MAGLVDYHSHGMDSTTQGKCLLNKILHKEIEFLGNKPQLELQELNLLKTLVAYRKHPYT